MIFSRNARRELVAEFGTITLRAIQPVLNGAPLADAHVQVEHDDAERILLSCAVPALEEARFWMEVERENESRITVRYWIEDLPHGFVLDSFGIRFAHVEGLRTFLRSGYFSWDGSEYMPVDSPGVVRGYAVTQLLPYEGNGSVVIGFLRHDRFQLTFTFTCETESTALTIETLWDRKTRVTGEKCESEPLVFLEHPEVEGALREWAQLVAAHSPLPPRHAERITGWCSWYNLYAYITEENILEHLRGAAEIARREQLSLRVFQIDDGFTPEMGDWLEVKPQFPRGMKPLLDDIRDEGLVPGLWIAPFMVGNRSHLFREHPDWVVREVGTGAPLAHMRFYEEFRWHKRSEEYYILDTTHPEAFEYLRMVFHTWHQEWGCEYFKTDFMQFGSEYGPDRAVWHTPGMTRMEIWRRVAEMIRAEIGGALWLGCGCPLWAGVGLMDAVRTGRDVGVSWTGAREAAALLRDVANRNFANGILWQADPDCVLLREGFHYLTDAEVRSLAVFGGLLGGVLTTSDALDELSPERLRLLKFLLDAKIRSCRFPFLGHTEDTVLVQVCHGERLDAVLVLNTGDTRTVRRWDWAALGLTKPSRVMDWTNGREWGDESEVVLTLDGHEAALLLLSEAPAYAVLAAQHS